MIRSFLVLACAVAVLALSPAASAQDASVPADGLDWHPFEEAVELARENKKKVIVDVYAQWCPWCRRLQRDVYTEEAVQSYIKEHFVLTRLDAEDQEESISFRELILTPAELSTGLGASGFPTTVFLDSETNYITRLPGFVEAGEFLNVLTYIGSDAFQKQSYQDFSGEQSQ